MSCLLHFFVFNPPGGVDELFVGVIGILSRMDRGRNEEVRRRAGIERELASRADQRVLDGLGMWKEWMSTV